MRKQLTTLAFAGIFVLCAYGVLTAQSQPGHSENYTWSGELVSFDGTTKTVTVKSRLVDQDAVNDLKRLKAGERALLQWSGFDEYADGIRHVMPYAERKSDERFMLPVELVSTEAPNQYVTFRVRVPEGSVPALKSVKPGEWVTATSSHRGSREQDAIVSIGPYNTSSVRSSD